MLHEDFVRHVLPLCDDDLRVAFQRFQSFRFVPQDDIELRRQAEISVRRLVYRADGADVDAGAVVLKLADFILNSLGRRLVQADVRAELEGHGYHLRDWARDTHVTGRVDKLNQDYLRHVEAEMIGGRPITRPESEAILTGLLDPNGKLAQLVVGTAGMGKSCVLAQVIHELREQDVRFIAIRLDNVGAPISTKGLGLALNLPDSPALVLAGISQGGRAVLVVDQLDAMSVVSGRSTELWDVFDELVREVRQHPNLRLLLACRAFDLDNDPRLAGLVKPDGFTQRCKLGLLPLDVVRTSVQEGGGTPGRLSAGELELLRTPFHLHLFLQGEPANPVPFGGRQELFARFWKTKRQKATQRNADFDRVVGVLTDALSKAETISVPEDRLDSVACDADILASENVLVVENGRYRFFHEAFFDYAFARRFVREGRDLARFLTEECGEQHLFRRAQVRQILGYQREDNWDAYLATLRRLFEHHRVRVHIKKLALDWLAQLDDPTPEEWAVVEPLLSHAQLQWGASGILGRTLPWFDLLNRLGVLSTLLAHPETEMVNRCFYGICSRAILAQRSAEIAKLLHPHRACDEPWKRRFQELLRAGEIHHSREMFDLTLNLVDQGLLDDADDLAWYSLQLLAEKRADWGVELLGRTLERMIDQAEARGESNPFTDRQHQRPVIVQFIRTAAQQAPVEFAERIVPIIRGLVLANERSAPQGGYHDSVWLILSGGEEYDTPGALLGSARRSLMSLARIDPQRCGILLSGWAELSHKTLRFLLLSAWLGNPDYFAELAAEFLIKNPSVFDVSHDMDMAPPLVHAISPIVSDGTYSKLESAIDRYATPYEKKHPQYRGTREMALWQQLPPHRLSRTAKLRIEELRRKFPVRKLTSFEKRMADQPRKGGFVPPPIPDHAFPKMTDEHWIRAFRRYDSDQAEPRAGRSAGGAFELAGPLRQVAKSSRDRFAALLLRLPDDILPTYFDAILQGLVEESREVAKGAANGQPGVAAPLDAPLSTETLLDVLERVHRLPGKPCARMICWVARAVAPRPVPEELVEIVSHYAIHDPDPEVDLRTPHADGEKYQGYDPLSVGINSVRGSAASAIARFLFEHPDLTDRLLPLVESLARDPAVAVRAANIEALLALLNTRRDRAVELFLETCESAGRLWSIPYVEDFLYHATFTHYSALQPLLRRMLAAPESESRLATARQVTLAAFRHREAAEDLSLVLDGDEECRRAEAEIYSNNVKHESVRDICVHRLMVLFNDPSKRVREAARDWFRERSGEWTEWQRNLFSGFIQSCGFADVGAECAISLERTPGPLPPEFLAFSEKAVTVFEEQSKLALPYAMGIAYRLPALLIRFYEQSKDNMVRSRCLDLLDRMLGLGWGEAATELGKVDR